MTCDAYVPAPYLHTLSQTRYIVLDASGRPTLHPLVALHSAAIPSYAGALHSAPALHSLVALNVKTAHVCSAQGVGSINAVGTEPRLHAGFVARVARAALTAINAAMQAAGLAWVEGMGMGTGQGWGLDRGARRRECRRPELPRLLAHHLLTPAPQDTSEPEKFAQHEALQKVVTTHTSHTWAAILVKMLLEQLGGKEASHRTPYIPRQVLESRYHATKKRLFFFDYDGILAPIIKTLSMVIPSAATLAALERLSADPRNIMYIISRRDGEFLEQQVGFSVEHGGFMREPGEETWVDLTEKLEGEVEVFTTRGMIHSVCPRRGTSATTSGRSSSLTQNVMEFQKCSFNGVVYSEGVTEAQHGAAIRAGGPDELSAKLAGLKQLIMTAMEHGWMNRYLQPQKLTLGSPALATALADLVGFFRALALCHSVLAEKHGGGDAKRVEYKAESPDEVALVPLRATSGSCLWIRARRVFSNPAPASACYSHPKRARIELAPLYKGKWILHI
ncbi:hypothetical protein C8R45DRAFT_1154871 [Mycena sanguinolenta]|nr:hypothetical protein C8R45DRAFT_1154871 [Mycena sanguinolenta]